VQQWLGLGQLFLFFCPLFFYTILKNVPYYSHASYLLFDLVVLHIILKNSNCMKEIYDSSSRQATVGKKDFPVNGSG
jgi:hypothetical protein